MDLTKILGKRQERFVTLDREAVDKDARTVTLSYSSETPVPRWWGFEILDHSLGACRMDRLQAAAPLLADHDSRQIVGVVEEAKCDPEEKKGRATVRFSRSPDGEVMYQDVLDGIRRNVSVGYVVHDARELKAEELTPEQLLQAAEEKLPFIRVTDWEPVEISIVGVPADVSVGVGRSAEDKNTVAQTPAAPDGALQAQVATLSAELKSIRSIITQGDTPVEKTQEDILKDERARVEEIDAISARFTGRVTKIDELRTQAVKEGWTPELFKGNIADRITDGKAIETPSSELGLSAKEMRQFSVLRLMNSMVPGAGSEAIKAAAFERECSAVVSAELSKSMPDFSPKGMLIPFEVQSASTTSRNIYGHPEYRQFFPRTGRRDMSVGDATHGANLVGTNLLASEFAPMLRDRLVTAQLGVRTLSGLVGNVSFPRQTGASTAYWPGEATNITAESNPVVGTVAMAPNEVGAYVDVSNRLLVQSTPGAEGLVRNDIMSQVAIAIDLAFFEGTGGVQPTGIESTTGVGTVNAAGLGWAELVEFETDVAAANADIGAMSYVVDAAGRGILKTREKSTGYPLFLMGDDGQANGYPVVATNFLTTGHMHFGVFSQGIIGEWGVMQLTVDPYGQAIGGITRFVVLHMVDVGIRQPAAFSFATNLS